MMECVSQRGAARPLSDRRTCSRRRGRAQLHPRRPLRDRRRAGRRDGPCGCPTRPSRPRPRAIRSSSGANWRSSMSARSPATVTVDGEAFDARQQGLPYVTDGREGRGLFAATGARFYLVSCPAHRRFETRKLSIAEANALERGSLEESNERTIYQLVIPGICDSAQLRPGPDRAEARQRLEHHAAAPARPAQRGLFLLRAWTARTTACSTSWAKARPCGTSSSANEEAVIAPPWSIHMGAGTARLRLHLGDGRREPGLYRHERPRHLPAAMTRIRSILTGQASRSSPAPTPASARPSPSALAEGRRRRRRWSGRTPPDETARDRGRARPAERAIIDADLGSTIAPVGEVVDERLSRARAARHPGQQRRHHPPRRRARVQRRADWDAVIDIN